MTKKKAVKEVKTKPIIFSDFFDWCASNGEALLFILFILSVISMLCISIPDKNDVVLGEKVNWWYAGLLFICISELLFAWMINNVGANADDLSDVAATKFIALIYSFPLTITLVASGLITIAHGLKILIAVLQAIGFFIVLGLSIYGYLKLNQWIARKIQ
jgi:hypothetical protein